jgi:hypothetical protein
VKRPGVLSPSNVLLGFVAAMLGLGVAVLLGVFWSTGDHWPFAVPTTTSTTSVTIYPVDVASKAVATGCGAVGRVTSEFIHDESRGVPVTSSASGALKEIEMMEQAGPGVLPEYSSIVGAAKDFSATLQQNVGSQRWRPVTTALNTLAAQCQLSLS